MIEITSNSQFTEIQIIWGGNGWITESFPTNFHTFRKRRRLHPAQSVEDYKEVTEAEKTALEGEDGKWCPPSEELITRWNEAWMPLNKRFGQYNETTGYFEGNGVLDITAKEALKILDIGYIYALSLQGGAYAMLNFKAPTLLPISSNGMLSGILRIEVDTIRVLDYYTSGVGWNSDTYPMNVTNSQGFLYASEVKHVLGILNVANDASYLRHFYNGIRCKNLQTLWVKNLKKGIELQHCSMFRFDCLKYMVENAMDTEGQSIVVHPDVYAKLTGDTANAAAAALTEEELVEWGELLTTAEEKTISFVTV